MIDKTFEVTNMETLTVNRLNVRMPYLPHTR